MIEDREDRDVTEDEDERFDVLIYERATGRVDAVVGERLRFGGYGRNTVETREATAMSRINERYGVTHETAGRYVRGDTIPLLSEGEPRRG